MPDDVLTLAYDSALNALREQDSTILNLTERPVRYLGLLIVEIVFLLAIGTTFLLFR